MINVGIPILRGTRLRIAITIVSFKDTLSSAASVQQEVDTSGHNRRLLIGTQTLCGTLHEPQSVVTGHTNQKEVIYYDNIVPKPADFSKPLPVEACSEGKPFMCTRRNFELFLTVFGVLGLDTTDHSQILDTTSLN